LAGDNSYRNAAISPIAGTRTHVDLAARTRSEILANASDLRLLHIIIEYTLYTISPKKLHICRITCATITASKGYLYHDASLQMVTNIYSLFD
jgi:hypothetical protein